jgi:Ser/Thr protein kinase RdoA (MazF antagonist)
MSWVPGRRLGRALRPQHYQQLGGLIASLHGHTMVFRPPRGFVRPRWDRDFEKRFENLRVAAKQRRLSRERLRFFEAARERAVDACRQVGLRRDVFGLIHADLGYANHLFHRGRAGAIDFEACGYGWFGHDIVEPLVFLQHSKKYPALCGALLEGYRRVRPLPRGTEAHLDDFIDLSALTSVGYIAGEATRQADLAWFSRYLQRVLRPPGKSHRRVRRT